MSRYQYIDEYEARFEQPPPNMYMTLMSDDEFSALLKKALDDGKPIDAAKLRESLYPPDVDI